MKNILPVLCLQLVALSVFATVKLPSWFGDNMVLQQKSLTPLWGWADPGATIHVSCSWEDSIYIIKADKVARWKTSIQTPPAGGPYTITISERNTIVLHHVMIGEVWLCSGQSNMEWTAHAGIDRKEEFIQNSNHPFIRHIRIPKKSSDYPQEDVEAKWEVCSPETMPHFSAVAYFFAKELTEKLNIPIGIIHASWGGSAIEAWTPKSIIESDPEYADWRNVFPADYLYPYLPGSTFNAMIHPLAPYTIAGALWYQGESNTSNAMTYRRLFPEMIKQWRGLWGYDFPFYFVQLAPFKYGKPLQGALVQEAQRRTALQVPQTGMVVTTDIGNVDDIHPRNKHDVGHRLALWALAKQYGQNHIHSGPSFKSFHKEGHEIKVEFDHIGEGLEIKGNKSDLYKIAGDNRQFVDATVKIEDGTLIFSSELVPDPIAVRYAFSNVAEGNLYNKAGLPASPFRTDDWPVVYNSVTIKSVYDAAQQGFLVSMEGNSDQIVYSLDGTEPGLQSKKYTGPFLVKQMSNIQAKAVVQNQLSETMSAKSVLMHKATYRPVQYSTPSSAKYPGIGNYTLINGQRGDVLNINDPEWQGWEGQPMEVIIDLGENLKTKKISIGFLQQQNQMVFLPSLVEFSVSSNGRTYTDVNKQTTATLNDSKPMYKVYSTQVNSNARYVRIKATNIGICPLWHTRSGTKAFLIADEVLVE